MLFYSYFKTLVGKEASFQTISALLTASSVA